MKVHYNTIAGRIERVVEAAEAQGRDIDYIDLDHKEFLALVEYLPDQLARKDAMYYGRTHYCGVNCVCVVDS